MESSEILVKLGKKDFAEYIWDYTSVNNDEPLEAATLVAKLVEDFPAFADIHNYHEKQIYIVKKAQLLCADLNRHFGESIPSHFAFSDLGRLTIMSDNVIPAVLRKFGILKYSKSLEETIDSAIILEPSEEEVELRSIAIFACQELCKECQKNFPERKNRLTEMHIDFYMWCKGKDHEFRVTERHYTQNTIFY